MSFQVTASGTDQNSQSVVNSNPASSGGVTIQIPASLSIESFTALPSSVGTGAPVTGVITVRNLGTSAASNLSPSSLTTNGVGVTFTAVQPASIASLAGGQAANFTFTASFDTAQSGISFTAQIFGVDAVQLIGVTSASSTSNAVSVFAQGNVNVQSLLIQPAGPVSVGQILTVIATVTNVGTGSAVSVTTALSNVGTAGLSVSATPAALGQTIISGTAATYTYTFSASAAGVVAVSVTTHGYDTLNTTLTAATGFATGVTVQAASALAISLNLQPATVSVGQFLTAFVTVTNTGGALATGVTLTGIPVPSSGALTTLPSGQSYTANLAPGQPVTFTYTYSASAPSASVNVAGKGQGIDTNSGVTVTSASPSTNSNNVLVQAPALLSSSFVIAPASALQGGTFTGVLTVSNAAGGANASLVSAGAAVVSSPTAVTVLSGPIPGIPQFLTAGASVAFTYTFSAVAITPSVTVSAVALGQDANSAVPLNTSATSNSFNVVNTNPILSSSFWLTPTPSTVSVNQLVTAVFAVVNSNGLVTATAVTANSVGSSGTAASQLFDGPFPASFASLAPSATGYFTYRFRFTAPGTAAFTGLAVATGANSGTITSDVSVTVQAGPALSVTSISLTPAAVSLGQLYTVTVRISNTGQATAVNVVPASMNKQGTSQP
jgi:hypothetical protein